MRNYFEDNEARCGVHPITSSRNDPMLGACIVHDKAYGKNQDGKSESSRKEADKKFYDNMGRLIEKRSESSWMRPVMKVQQIVYYGLVRAFGWFSWGKKK